MNYSGDFDRVQAWFKTEGDDLSSEATIGSANLTQDGVDVFGDTFSTVGLSNDNATQTDSIRIGGSFSGVLLGQ